MNHDDHVRLIQRGLPHPGGRWADLGAGRGAFTLALRDVAGPEVEIFAVDRDRGALTSLRREMENRFPGTRLHTIQADFTRQLDLPALDGIIAANSAHYVRDHAALLGAWRPMLVPGGTLILVEYDTDQGNRWVPHPLSFARLGPVARAAGYADPVLIGTHPSSFMRQFYAAALTNTP